MRKSTRLVVAVMCFVSLTSCGGGSSSPPPPPPPSNAAPIFSSPTVISLPEQIGGVTYTASATDSNTDPITFALAGGVDQGQFRITSGGALSFVAPPDFERPADADQDNVYLVSLAASDGKTSATLNLTINVTNASDGYRLRRVADLAGVPISISPAHASARGDTSRLFVAQTNGVVEIVTPATADHFEFLNLGRGGADVINTEGSGGLRDFRVSPDFGATGFFWSATYLDNTPGRWLALTIGRSDNDRDRGLFAGSRVLTATNYAFDAQSVALGSNLAWVSQRSLYFMFDAGSDRSMAQRPDRSRGHLTRIDLASDRGIFEIFQRYTFSEVASGLNRSFGMSYDPVLGLIFGDRGTTLFEEVNLLRPPEIGINFGFPLVEGTMRLDGDPPLGAIAPIIQYPHGLGSRRGRSVVGGVVYRGPISALRDHYIFADQDSGQIFSVPISEISRGNTLEANRFFAHTADFAPINGVLSNPTAIGTSTDGTLYVADSDGEIYVVEAA